MKVLLTAMAAVVIACGVAAAADDPLQTAGDNLRAAVDGKKPAADIKRLALVVFTEAKKQMGPAPADADKESWDAHVKYAEQTSEYAEYALYSAAAGAPAATAIDLISTLEAQAPKSKYLNQDAYMMVANAALNGQQGDRAAAFARKSLTAPKGAKPDQATGSAHYIIGVVAGAKKDNATADKELKAALPGIKGIPALEGPAYFFLGEAEYALGRQSMDRAQADQGIKYLLQCSLITGQYQSAAAGEARRMKTEMGEK
jgi:aminopeptidase N